MDRISERISRQLNDALDRWNNLSGFTPQNIRDVDLLEAHTLLAEAINSIAPKDSQYRRRADVVLADEDLRWQVGQLAGIVTALRAACWGGYLGTVAALVQADVFQDFLEMAEHLLDNGYKDPAAVLAGGVLEEHLRKACVRQGIETVLNDRPKPASRMNDELVGSGAYTQQDAKSVTAWLDLRNRAAHGKYPEYSKEQVGLMLHGVRHFIARTSAG